MKKRLATMMLIMVTVFAMLPVMAWAEQTVSSVNLIYDVADFCLYSSSPEGTVNKNITQKVRGCSKIFISGSMTFSIINLFKIIH